METPKIKERLSALKLQLVNISSSEGRVLRELLSYMEDLCENVADVEDATDFPEENITKIPQFIFSPFFEGVKSFLNNGAAVQQMLVQMFQNAGYSEDQSNEAFQEIYQLMGIPLLAHTWGEVNAHLMGMSPEEYAEYVQHQLSNVPQ